MVKDNLVGKVKSGFYKTMAVGALTLGGFFGYGCGDNGVEPEPIDNAPRITHSYLSPTSGIAPLKVTAQLTCEDDKAVTGYTLISGNDTTRTRNPIDTIITYNESTDVTRECEDAKRQKVVEGLTRIEVLQPSYSQTAEVRDSVNVRYNATFENINRAILEVKNGNVFSFTDTITTPSYTRDFNDLPKGANLFILTPEGLVPDTVTAPILDYAPREPDLGSLELRLNDVYPLAVNLEDRFQNLDPNSRDNPVPIIGVGSLDGKVVPIFEGYDVTINALKDSLGIFEVEFEYGTTIKRTVIKRGEIMDTGEVSGVVVWDLDGDGVYEPSQRALVTLSNAPYAWTGEERTEEVVPGGGLRCLTSNMCVITAQDGSFLLKDVSEGQHVFYSLNLSNPNTIGGEYPAYSVDDSVSVVGDAQIDLGNIKIEKTNIIH